MDIWALSEISLGSCFKVSWLTLEPKEEQIVKHYMHYQENISSPLKLLHHYYSKGIY
jgi:hypothetical protein